MKKEKLSRWLDTLVVAYCFAVVLYQAVYLITPLRLFMEDYGLTRLSQLMAVGGVCLFAADLVLDRVFWKAKYIWCLLAVLVIMGLSSLVHIRYGIVANAKNMIWQLSQMLVIFPAYRRLPTQKWERVLQWLYWAVSAFYIPTILLSLYQFVSLDPIIRIDHPYAVTGFTGGRLFGLFFILFFASVMCAVLLVASIYYAATAKKTACRALYGAAAAVYGVYVVLTDTRSVFLALLVVAMLGGLILGQRRFAGQGPVKGWVCGILVALCAAVCFFGIYKGVGSGLKAAVRPVHEGIYRNDQTQPSPTDPSAPTEPTQIQLPEMERADVELSNISNNRFTIWREYLQVTTQDAVTVLLGLSPGEYTNVIRDKYPDLYIVRHIRENYPAAYEFGTVYDVHNAYLCVFVTTGLLGLAAIALFLALCVKRVLPQLFTKPGKAQLALTVMVLVILICAFFDNDLFFRCTNTSVLFWLLAGILLKTTESEKCASTE